MARSISEQELQLKKRARRRLVGAIVLVTTVAVVLPMVLDSEPKPVRQNVDIHIPSPDAAEYNSRPSEATQHAPTPIKGLPEGRAETTPGASAAASATNAPAAQPSSPSPVQADVKPELSEAPAVRRPAASERSESTRTASNAAPSKPQTSAARTGASPSTAKPEASPPRTTAGPVAAKPESPATRAESARNTSATAKRTTEAEADSGSYVVQIAALADAAKARQLQKQMSGAGLKTYTEVLSTKTGDVTRVRAGPYATREAAEKARAQLKKAGLDGQVVVK